jgi:hypothetical protein
MQKLFEPENDNLRIVKNYKEKQSTTKSIHLTTQEFIIERSTEFAMFETRNIIRIFRL